MRLVFAGTPEVAVPALDALLESRHEVLAVLTRPDAPTGRGRPLAASPVSERAVAAGLETLKPAKASDPALLDRLRALSPDCATVTAYGALIRPDALTIPRLGWINLHFSLLPAWRGAAPVQHAVLHGDEVTGATVFQLEQGLDTGPVLGVLTETVRPRDTTGDLLGRLASAGARLLVATLDALEDGDIAAVPQPPDGVSYAPKLTVQDARVDWSRPAYYVDRLVRACTPAPGAWTTWQGDRLGLDPVQPGDSPDLAGPGPGDLVPGRVRVERREVVVECGDGKPVRLGQVRPAGRRPMAADAWARGVRDLDGRVLV